MKKKKAFPLFALAFAGWLGGSCLLNQGCSSPQGPTGPATAGSPTPTPVPNDVVFNIDNAANGTTVWEIIVMDNSNGLSNYTYCSVAGGSTQAVPVLLPSGSGSYQVTVDCNVGGYCRKAVLNPVSLTVGGTCNVTISPTGSVTAGSVTCPAMTGC